VRESSSKIESRPWMGGKCVKNEARARIMRAKIIAKQALQSSTSQVMEGASECVRMTGKGYEEG
jgi:hypothetical protein